MNPMIIKEGRGPYVDFEGRLWFLTGNIAHGDYEMSHPGLRNRFYATDGVAVRENDANIAFDLTGQVPLAVEIEASEGNDPTFFATVNTVRTVGEVTYSESASLSIPTLSDLRELHQSGELGVIVKSMLTKESQNG